MEEINYEANNLLRVAIYLRLSDEDRDKSSKLSDSESIKNQRNLLMDEIAKRDDFILVDEYCDEDLSGAGTFRPEFERLIKDCEKGKIDVVLCKSQSRFSRDMEVVEKYINNKFIEWGIRFIGLSDNADTANSGNKKSRQINSLVNEWYLEDVSNNIKSAFMAKMKQGEFISPFAAFGYVLSDKDNNKLVIDPIASEIVKEIYYMYLKGYGFVGIAKYLNDKKVPSPSLYKYQNGIKLNVVSKRPREKIKWSANVIKTILTNELYIGNLIQGKRTTVSYKNHKIKTKSKQEWIRCNNTHEAIIDKDTFNKVQVAMRERTKSVKITGIVHNFSGKVFCLECGHYMRKKVSGNFSYLVCSNNRDGYDDCINKRSIRYDVLENIVLKEINNKIREYYDEELISAMQNEKYRSSIINKVVVLERQRLELEKKVSEIRKYLKYLYEDKVNGVVTNEQFKYLVSDYSSNENIYNERLKTINNEIAFCKEKSSSLDNSSIFMKTKVFRQLNRVIIDEFIKRIYIGKVDETKNMRAIHINWNF